MGQYWRLVNVDKRAKLRNFGGLKLWEFLMGRSAEQLVGLLRKNYWINFNIPGEIIQASKRKSSGSPLIGLPQEIVGMILCLLGDGSKEQDIICLALTCTYFTRLLAGTIQQTLRRDLGPWAGDRLIFIGDYASGYPNGLATAEEHLEWEKFEYNPLYVMPEGVVSEGRSSAPPFSRYEESTTFGVLLEHIRERLGEEEESLRCLERLMRLLMQEPSSIKLEDKAPVLRNLTTKEYVRDAALAESDYAFSLGEVIVSFAQWTDDPSGTEGLGTKGRWAGHRFDIARTADVAVGDWKDVSKDAIETLEQGTGEVKKDGLRA